MQSNAAGVSKSPHFDIQICLLARGSQILRDILSAHHESTWMSASLRPVSSQKGPWIHDVSAMLPYGYLCRADENQFGHGWIHRLALACLTECWYQVALYWKQETCLKAPTEGQSNFLNSISYPAINHTDWIQGFQNSFIVKNSSFVSAGAQIIDESYCFCATARCYCLQTT